MHETCWTMIRGAARGEGCARDVFATTYLPVVRGYLSARWRGTPFAGEIDDAVQEAFVDCFREDGALGRTDAERPGGFRAFLYAVVRNVALRVETKRARRAELVPVADVAPEEVASADASLSRVFDRAWALSLMKAAAARHERTARVAGDDAVRRFELLRLRFDDDLPIRDIAARWNVEADFLHHEFAKARREFREALHAEVAFHHPGPPDAIAARCAELVAILR